MTSFIKQLFRPQPRISREQALEVAEAACQKDFQKSDYKLEKPLRFTEGRHTIVVRTRLNTRPQGPVIKLNVHTGEVISIFQLPR